MPYCEKCGKEIDEDAAFCIHCGTPVVAPGVVYRRPRSPGWNAISILAVVFGGLLLLVSFGLLVGGGAVIWVQSTFSDSEGFLMSRETRLQSDSHAMVLHEVNITIDVDIPSQVWTPKPSDFVTVKLVGQNNDPSKEIFMGIARDTEASRYLSSVEYDRITIDPSWNEKPWRGISFSASYNNHPGQAPSQPPTSMTIWDASASGSGTQTLNWEPASGSFWVVVMNADGSADVDIDMQLGVKIPILRAIGGGLLTGGFITLVIGGLIIYFGAYRPRNPAYRG